MSVRLLRPFRDWLIERPGLPVVLLGAAYVGYGLVHLWQLPELLTVDFIGVALYELLALSVVYGGLRVSRRGLPALEGFRVFGATLAFGTIGFAVAAALIAVEAQRGTPLNFIWFASAFASVTTAAIGTGLALYYVELRAERANLSAQHRTVSELNKRLTVLHRVLRHNLRNELTIIRGHAELLLSRDPAPDVAESLNTLLRHTRQVESLSENAYRLRQVWAEDAVVEKEVTELVETCVRELEADHPEADISTEMPTHVVARMHPRFRLAVTEALENAVVHNDLHEVEVAITVRALESESAVEIVIADTGSGIPEFEPGVLEQGEERPLHHATGLGLWLIYWVVEQSGGTLQFEENAPQGTRVRIRLSAGED